jgi:hypothetical protein
MTGLYKMFNQDQIVVIFNEQSQPIMLGTVEQIKSNAVVVKGANFSKSTGAILGKQSSSGTLYTPPSAYSRNKPRHIDNHTSILVQDIAGHIDVFDVSLLEDRVITNQRINLDILENVSVSELLGDIAKTFKDANIPDDAIVSSIDGEEIKVSYTRKETMSEYEDRVYRKPIIAQQEKAIKIASLNEKKVQLEKEQKEVEDQLSSLS